MESVEITQLEETGKMSPVVKYGRTLNLIIGCLGMGLMTSVIGTTLQDLAEVYDVHTDQVAHIFSFRGVGALMGSLLGGLLLDRFNTQALLMSSTMLASAMIALIPKSPSLPIAYAVTYVYGLTVGIFDTGEFSSQ